MGFYDQITTQTLIPKLGIKINTVTNLADYPQANVIIVHGLGEHLEKYDQLTSFLLDHHCNMIRYDQPGHGRSEGERGFLNAASDLEETLTEIVKQVNAQYYYFPTFLIGHSMGGFTILRYLTKHSGQVAGAVAVDPFSVYQTPTLGQLPLEGDSHRVIPDETSGGTGVNADPRVEKRAANDPDNLADLKAGIMNALGNGAVELKANLKKITDPIFFLHGQQDGVVDYHDTLTVFDQISSTDKELHLYPYIMHSLLVDPSRQSEIYNEILRWIERHHY